MTRDARRKLVVIGLAALATLSICANALQLVALRESFSKLQLARIFPLGYDDTNEAPSSDVTPHLAVYGDSRALMWRTVASLPRESVVNLAHGGITSKQLLLSLESDVRRSKWAIVEVGINDLHPIGAAQDQRESIVKALHANLSAILERLLERSENVIFCTIVSPARTPLERLPVWSDATLTEIAKANDIIRKFASRPNVFVLDADAALRQGNGPYIDPRFADPDFFLHFNASAYEVLNREAAAILAQSRH